MGHRAVHAVGWPIAGDMHVDVSFRCTAWDRNLGREGVAVVQELEADACNKRRTLQRHGP